MKPLLTFVISATSLAIVAAADPSSRDYLLNAGVPTAWAQQDRGRGEKEDKDHKDRDDDRDRGDKDGDKGKEREDRDSDRDAGDKGKEREERDNDRGGGNKDEDRAERDDDRGGKGNKDEDRVERDDDRGGGNGNKDEDRAERDDDRGGGNGNKDEDRAERDDDSGRGNNEHDRGGPNEDADDHNANNDNPGGSNENDGANANTADRDAEPAERVAGEERDGDTGELAGRFDLDDNETFDDDGFLARRGEIIAMSNDSLLRRRAVALGLEVMQQEFLASLNTTMYRLSVPAASPIDGILARLRAQDPEGVFDRNHLYDRSAATVASSSGAQSHALMGTAKGISVGLIDTGVDALHPALAGTNVELRYFVDGARALPEAHGTAVVSLLVSPQFGVLPDAQLYVACVFYEDRRGGSLSEARDLVRALDWLMQRRVPVINMSLSGPPNEVLRAAIKRAIEAGHLIVAAVGNAGPASPPLYPAAYDGVIAVTAVDGDQHVYRRATRGAHVELAATGVDVVAAGPAGTATYSGTSFASPYVAALAAMEYRSLDPQKALAVKETLRENALDLGKPGRDEIYGFGLARPRTISTVAR
jgi:subtilisin family serine protease